MNEIDILFPIPERRRNADDMGLPSPAPAAAPAADEPDTFTDLREYARAAVFGKDAAAPAAPAPECMYRNGCQTPADCRASGRCFESNYPHKRAAPDAEHSTDGAESRRAGHAPTIGPSPSTYADDLVRLLHGASDGYSSVNLNGAAKMCHDAAALIGELRATVEQQAREIAALRTQLVDAQIVVNAQVGLQCDRAERAERDLSAARKAIAAADADAARYRWLRPLYFAIDWEYETGEGTAAMLLFAWPLGQSVSGSMDATIDAARAAMGDGNG